MKNQFRSLDDDEVDFLDSVLESTRAKEAAIRRETSDQLEAFRKQCAAAERIALEHASGSGGADDMSVGATDKDTWTTAGKRRKRTKDTEKIGGKLRKMSSLVEEKIMEKHKPCHNSDDNAKDLADATRRSSNGKPTPDQGVGREMDQSSGERHSLKPAAETNKAPVVHSALGLGDYSSDGD